MQVHKHNFKAKPVAFVWDWLEFPAPLHGAGCMTLNGVFLCWLRGMPSAIDLGDFSELGPPVARIKQNEHWFQCIDLPKSIAPKNAPKTA